MATDVNVIADYGVHKTTRKDTLEPSDTTLAIFLPRPCSREFWLAPAKLLDGKKGWLFCALNRSTALAKFGAERIRELARSLIYARVRAHICIYVCIYVCTRRIIIWNHRKNRIFIVICKNTMKLVSQNRKCNGTQHEFCYTLLARYIKRNICNRAKTYNEIKSAHFTCVFIGEMRLDNFLYAYFYVTMQVCVDIP